MRSVNLTILWLIFTLDAIMIAEHKIFMVTVRRHTAIENLLRKASSFGETY